MYILVISLLHVPCTMSCMSCILYTVHMYVVCITHIRTVHDTYIPQHVHVNVCKKIY